MSFNRENDIWQSADGTWSRGFWETTWVGSEPEYDPEWDAEYGDEFWIVITGLPSEEAAHRAWDGANPGGYSMLEYNENTAAECARLDAKAARVKAKGVRTGHVGWYMDPSLNG